MRGVAWLMAVSVGSVTAAVAAEPAAKQPTVYDDIWRYANWYKNDDNPVLQSFDFTGRFQVDYNLIDADQGDNDEWNVRRLRVGGKAKAFKNLTLHGEVDLNPQETDPVYQKITDAYISWSQDKSFVASIGKQSAPFTLDGATSSKELITIDRNNVANNFWFPQEYIPGVSASGKIDQWKYFAGVYSAGDATKEFGRFNGGAFGLGSLGYDFAKALEVKQALLAAQYVYQDEDPENTFTRSLEHLGSLNFSLDTGKWGLRTDLVAAQGYGGQSDMWGAVLMPFVNFTPKFQGVTRYTHIESSDPAGVRLATYENAVVTKRGDQYDEGYAGLNYYFHGHKLKLQTGLQYAEIKDETGKGGEYQGWSWTTGLRLGW